MIKIYEKYHSTRRTQKRIIKDTDFTYREILSLLKKYSYKSKTILDIGCGVGTIDFFLAKGMANVTGIDVSRKGVEVAKENAKNLGIKNNLKFKVINFPKKIPLGKFDLIICSEVLEHINDDNAASNGIYRLLKKGGIAIVSSPSMNAPLFKIGFLKQFDSAVGHRRRYTEESFRKLFETSGFRIIQVKKTEGILRNFLFTNSFGGFLLRFINKWPLSEAVSFVDNLTISVLGESNIYMVLSKQ